MQDVRRGFSLYFARTGGSRAPVRLSWVKFVGPIAHLADRHSFSFLSRDQVLIRISIIDSEGDPPLTRRWNDADVEARTKHLLRTDASGP